MGAYRRKFGSLNNGNGIFDYEVALEILGQSKQPLVSALFNERNRENQIKKLIALLRVKKSCLSTYLRKRTQFNDEQLLL